MRRNKRNPAVRWAEPVQGQGARQQARFLLQVEQAMATDSRLTDERSLLLNQQTRAVLEVGGVPLNLLQGPGQPEYAKAIDVVLKEPWVELKGHPLLTALNATKEAVSRCMASAASLEYLEQDCSTALLSEAELSQHNEALLVGWEPKLQPLLKWRHQVADIASTVLGQGVAATELVIEPAGLAELQRLADQTQAVIEARREAFVAKRKTEFAERFGHQPTQKDRDGVLDEAMFIAYGKTLHELMEDLLGPGRAIAVPGESPLPTDWTTLGLKPGAATIEIKRAFRALAKEHHPDVGGNTQQFIALAAAAERLLMAKGAQR